MTLLFGAETFLAQMATTKASENATLRLSIAIDITPPTASQKLQVAKTEAPIAIEDAVRAPEERVTCLTSKGSPKNEANCGVIARRNASDRLEAIAPTFRFRNIANTWVLSAPKTYLSL